MLVTEAVREQSNRYLHALFYFIDFSLKIPDDLQETLRSDLTKFVGKEDVHHMRAKEMEMSPTLAGIFEDLEKMAIEKGVEKGKVEGSQEAKLSIARNLLQEEFSDEKIVELTGLEKEEIESLRESPDN